MSTEITVRGSFSAFLPPERGTVMASLSLEGSSMDAVYDNVVRALAHVRGTVEALHDPAGGPVTWWAAQQVRTSSHRPRNDAGKQLPLVHRAVVMLQVKFSDLGELGRWVGARTGDTRGFRVERVSWTLTEDRRRALDADARQRAVRDAVERAQAYADALGLGEVRPVAVAEAGMLDRGLTPSHGAPQAFARGAAAAGAGQGPELALVPEDVEVSSQVDARFVAG